jgi:hypothetical protein
MFLRNASLHVVTCHKTKWQQEAWSNYSGCQSGNTVCVLPNAFYSTCFQSAVLQRTSTNRAIVFNVLLTVHLGLIFVNYQFDAQFVFMYVYFYSLHVSGNHVPIIMRINCINTKSVICHLYRVTYTRCRIDTINLPDDGHIVARNM